MIEDQATLSQNLPVRLFMYIARIYEKILPDRVALAAKLFNIPKPDFIVLYNGKDEAQDIIKLKLSEAFIENIHAKTKETLELTLTVYNINPGHNEDIRNKSRALWEYSTFVAKIHELEKTGATLAEAVEAGVQYCIENDIMAEFLRKHSSEVNNMLFAEYDPVEARKVAIEEGYEDGFEEGFEDGIDKGRAEERMQNAKRMKDEGLDTDLITKVTGLSKSAIVNM
jgi:predicted transposase/invertase (TIGR01784 family)